MRQRQIEVEDYEVVGDTVVTRFVRENNYYHATTASKENENKGHPINSGRHKPRFAANMAQNKFESQLLVYCIYIFNCPLRKL